MEGNVGTVITHPPIPRHCEDCVHCFSYYARDVVGRRYYDCTLADPPVPTDAEDTCEFFERRSDALARRS
jgi:hypothetical protein